MKHFTAKEKQVLEAGKHHRKIEKEKGFLPPSFLLVPEIAKLFETVSRLVLPDGQKMNYTRREIFRALDKNDFLSQQDLAKFAHISAATVSVELTEMEKEKLIKREKDKTDGRIQRIFLTAKGKKKNEELKKANKIISSLITKNLTQEEEKILSTLLLGVRNRLLDHLEEIERES